MTNIAEINMMEDLRLKEPISIDIAHVMPGSMVKEKLLLGIKRNSINN